MEGHIGDSPCRHGLCVRVFCIRDVHDTSHAGIRTQACNGHAQLRVFVYGRICVCRHTRISTHLPTQFPASPHGTLQDLPRGNERADSLADEGRRKSPLLHGHIKLAAPDPDLDERPQPFTEILDGEPLECDAPPLPSARVSTDPVASATGMLFWHSCSGSRLCCSGWLCPCHLSLTRMAVHMFVGLRQLLAESDRGAPGGGDHSVDGAERAPGVGVPHFGGGRGLLREDRIQVCVRRAEGDAADPAAASGPTGPGHRPGELYPGNGHPKGRAAPDLHREVSLVTACSRGGWKIAPKGGGEGFI